MHDVTKARRRGNSKATANTLLLLPLLLLLSLPVYCHAIAMLLPCCCHIIAMLLQCYCHDCWPLPAPPAPGPVTAGAVWEQGPLRASHPAKIKARHSCRACYCLFVRARLKQKKGNKSPPALR